MHQISGLSVTFLSSIGMLFCQLLGRDCETNIIHNVDLTWAILATVGGVYPLMRLLEHWHKQSGRDLFALIATLVAYPWAMAIMHLTVFDKGLVYAICVFTIALYGVAVMRVVGLNEAKLGLFRQVFFLVAAALAVLALSNPWYGQFALFDVPVLGEPNHLLDYQIPGLGAHLTLLFSGLVVVGTTLVVAVRLMRSRFVLSYSLLGVLLPVVALLAYFNSALWNLFEQLQVNPYFFTTTATLFYFSYLSVRGQVVATLPPGHNQIISLMPDAIVIVDGAGVVVECNPAFEALACQPASKILTQPLSSLLADTSFLDDDKIDRCLLTLNSGAEVRSLDLHITVLANSESKASGKMIVVRDVTDQTAAFQKLQVSERRLQGANDELARLSTTDSLTGLRNRRYFQHQLEQELERFNRGELTFGLLSLDLDHFKNINDCHGHQAGDAVLVQTSRILESHCRTTDTLARMGGEEFMVLLVGCDQKRLLTAAERLREAVEQQVVTTNLGVDLSVSTSVGATLIQPEDSMRELLHRVDDLLYCAKRQGRNRTIAL